MTVDKNLFRAQSSYSSSRIGTLEEDRMPGKLVHVPYGRGKAEVSSFPEADFDPTFSSLIYSFFQQFQSLQVYQLNHKVLLNHEGGQPDSAY